MGIWNMWKFGIITWKFHRIPIKNHGNIIGNHGKRIENACFVSLAHHIFSVSVTLLIVFPRAPCIDNVLELYRYPWTGTQKPYLNAESISATLQKACFVSNGHGTA